MIQPNNLISVHIADIHMGKIDPSTQYQILKEQFILPISQLPRIDLIAINGDIFDRKFLANSDPIRYAVQFIDDIVQLAKIKNSTVIIIAGTLAHDNGQIKLFYHYLEDPSIDLRIVETIRFEDVKGARVLCIPELYNIDESIYQHFFHESSWYDLALIHGTYKGSVYGDNVGQGRLLTKEDFTHCKGLCTSGHIHTPGCFDKFYYYCGSPIALSFEAEGVNNGYLISNQDLSTGIHYVEFEEITSFRYETIYLDQLVSNDPKDIIDYINTLKKNKGIDYIKVRFRVDVSGSNKTIINNYYRNNGSVTVEFKDTIDSSNEANIQQSISSNDQYSYLTDNKLSDLERFVRFVNESEGYQYITISQLTELLSQG